jgi:hypothetical protein
MSNDTDRIVDMLNTFVAIKLIKKNIIQEDELIDKLNAVTDLLLKYLELYTDEEDIETDALMKQIRLIK